MAMRLAALKGLNGEMVSLEFGTETTGGELKQQIKEAQLDEVARKTTGVEIVVGDRLMSNDTKVLDAQLEDLVVNIVFKP